MPKGSKKKPAPLPAGAKKTIVKPETVSLYEPKKRNFGIGQAIQPRLDLGRMVKWPRYVRLQRQRQLLKMRLKVPPSIAQFSKTLDLNTATQLFKLLDKYKKEEKAAKKERLAAQAAGGKTSKPFFVKCGINHVTKLVESKRAKLVVIAHDVDPIETIVWLPALCRHMDIPYCIVKGKARLGTVVGMKTATCLALTEVKQEHSADLAKICESVKSSFNDEGDKIRRQWGGGIMGIKNRARMKIMKQKLAKDKNKA